MQLLDELLKGRLQCVGLLVRGALALVLGALALDLRIVLLLLKEEVHDVNHELALQRLFH